MKVTWPTQLPKKTLKDGKKTSTTEPVKPLFVILWQLSSSFVDFSCLFGFVTEQWTSFAIFGVIIFMGNWMQCTPSKWPKSNFNRSKR